MIAHRLFFLRDTCCSVQFWICTNTPELYDFNVASVFDLSCSPGWSDSKISSENYTNTAENISNEAGVLIPHAHCLGSGIIAFSVVQTRRAAFINTPKIWYLHWKTEYSQNKKLGKLHRNENKLYTCINIFNCEPYSVSIYNADATWASWYPQTRQFDLFNSMTWLTAKEIYVNSPIPKEINCDILP